MDNHLLSRLVKVSLIKVLKMPRKGNLSKS